MKDRPILFSGPMVRALIDGTKTQTRRIVKPQPAALHHLGIHRAKVNDGPHCQRIYEWGMEQPVNGCFVSECCPYGVPGDRLWIRETIAVHSRHCEGQGIGYTLEYRADGRTRELQPDLRVLPGHECYPHQKIADKGWRPSIHMPRWASRITLEITDVRVQRLQDISEEDAALEGVEGKGKTWACPLLKSGLCLVVDNPRRAFRGLWDMVNGAGSWYANPWVWAISFRRITP